MTSTQKAIIDRALALVGCGYVWGATGWICTQARLDAQAKQYPDQAENIRKYGPKWIGRVCYDCAQLTKAVLGSIGVTLPSGATSQWSSGKYARKGTMDTFPANTPGVQLFLEKSPGVMQHTGISLGDGTFVDARGSADGVLHSKISSYKWTHWALPAALEGEASATQSAVVAPAQSTLVKVIAEPDPGQAKVVTMRDPLNLRERPDAASMRIDKMPIGTIVDVLGRDGQWAQVRYKGRVGWACAEENGNQYLRFG